MRWVKESYIVDFFAERNYDVRISGNARWIDQKCAVDVVTVIADCILQYVEMRPDAIFTSKDIQHSDYAINNVENIFKKPKPNQKTAYNEYNKFFQQPMEMFSYIGALQKIKIEKDNRNYYRVVDVSILEYIALRERNALTFLNLYITKVLTDSELIGAFEEFFDKQTKDAYCDVKEVISTALCAR